MQISYLCHASEHTCWCVNFWKSFRVCCYLTVGIFQCFPLWLWFTTYIQHYWWQKRRIIQEITTYGTHRCAAGVAPMSVGLLRPLPTLWTPVHWWPLDDWAVANLRCEITSVETELDWKCKKRTVSDYDFSYLTFSIEHLSVLRVTRMGIRLKQKNSRLLFLFFLVDWVNR